MAIIEEIHKETKECFHRHEFITYGDVLNWWHKIGGDEQKKVSGKAGISEFSKDMLWLISQHGPTTKIDYGLLNDMKISKPPKPVTDDNDTTEEKPAKTKTPKKTLKKQPIAFNPLRKKRRPKKRKF